LANLTSLNRTLNWNFELRSVSHVRSRVFTCTCTHGAFLEDFGLTEELNLGREGTLLLPPEVNVPVYNQRT